jgi:hypothetical protein
LELLQEAQSVMRMKQFVEMPASNSVLLEALLPKAPTTPTSEKEFFNAVVAGLNGQKLKYFQGEIKKRQRTLVFRHATTVG